MTPVNPFIKKFGEDYISFAHDSIGLTVKEAIGKYLPIQSGKDFPLIDLIADYAQHLLLYKMPPQVLSFLRDRCTVAGREGFHNFQLFFALPLPQGKTMNQLVPHIYGMINNDVFQKYGKIPLPKGWVAVSSVIVPADREVPTGFTLLDPGICIFASMETKKQTGTDLYDWDTGTKINGRTSDNLRLSFCSNQSGSIVFYPTPINKPGDFAIQKLFLEE